MVTPEHEGAVGALWHQSQQGRVVNLLITFDRLAHQQVLALPRGRLANAARQREQQNQHPEQEKVTFQRYFVWLFVD